MSVLSPEQKTISQVNVINIMNHLVLPRRYAYILRKETRLRESGTRCSYSSLITPSSFQALLHLFIRQYQKLWINRYFFANADSCIRLVRRGLRKRGWLQIRGTNINKDNLMTFFLLQKIVLSSRRFNNGKQNNNLQSEPKD